MTPHPMTEIERLTKPELFALVCRHFAPLRLTWASGTQMLDLAQRLAGSVQLGTRPDGEWTAVLADDAQCAGWASTPELAVARAIVAYTMTQERRAAHRSLEAASDAV